MHQQCLASANAGSELARSHADRETHKDATARWHLRTVGGAKITFRKELIVFCSSSVVSCDRVDTSTRLPSTACIEADCRSRKASRCLLAGMMIHAVTISALA